jgi:peptidoglycan/xylan/chitin deacetylase (PgdA/CDA1 family)
MFRKLFILSVTSLAIAILLACVAASIGCQQDPKGDGGEAAEDVTQQDDSNGAGGSDSQDADSGGGITATGSTDGSGGQGGQSGGGSPADTTPPVVSGIAAIDITSISAKVAWNTDEPATSLAEYGLTSSYGSASPADANLVTSHSVVLSGLTSGTTYHFRIKSKDAAGNEAVSQDIGFTTVKSDVNAPLISDVSVTDITQDSARVTWTTDEPATSVVEYGLSSIYGSTSGPDSDRMTSHSIVLSGLISGTTYHFSMKSQDASGNEALSADGVFTTVRRDVTPPAISNVAASNVTQNSAKITWKTDEPATSQVEYGLTSGYGSSSPADANLVTSHSVVLNGLASGTKYHFSVQSKDASGNEAISGDATFTTVQPDVTPPVISNVAATNVTHNSARITWKTNEQATSQVEYGLTSGYGSASPADANLVTSHSVTLSGLTSSTTYHFMVRSEDASGNEAVSGDATFTTAQTSSDGFNRAILSMTFDDGWEDSYTYALPQLNDYGFKTTQYLCTQYLTAEYSGSELYKIQAYAKTGHEIGSHTVTHPFLPQVTPEQLDYELRESKAFLESIFGAGNITNFATPYGEYNDAVVDAITQYYQSHRSVDEGYNSKANFDIYNIMVQNMTNTTTLSEVQSWIENAKAGNYWLVIVYHRIGPDPDTYETSPEDFYAQLAMIASEGIAVETVQDALAEILPQLS